MLKSVVRLTDLDQIMPEVDRLQQQGYVAQGNWDLPQTCEHLADWMSFPMYGFPQVAFPMSCLLTLARLTQGKRMLRKIIETGTMNANAPTLSATVYGQGMDCSSAIERLRTTVQRLKNHTGPFHPSPLFGEMSRDEVIALHLVHCSHHLNFMSLKM